MPRPLPTTLLNTIASHTGPINALTFSSQGGTYILTGSSDRSIHLSRTIPPSTPNAPSAPPSSSSSSPLIQRYLSHGYPLLSLTCSPTNTTFASSSSGDREPLHLWDVTSATVLRRFSPSAAHAHTARINTVTFGGDGGDAVLISGSNDASVRVWDVRSRSAAPVMVLSGARDAVSVVRTTGDSEVLAGSVDGRLRSYDVRTGRCTVDRLPASIGGVCVTKDARAVAVSTLDDRVRLLERGTGALLQSFPGGKGEGDERAGPGGEGGYANSSLRLHASFGVNESILLSGSEADGRVRAWDVLTGRGCGSVEPPRDQERTRTSSERDQAKRLAGKSWSDSKGEKEKVPVVSVVEWRGEGGRGNVWACGGVEGRVWVYGRGGEE
ncbi:MAG: hypothetical protein Q9160_001528 [Pyrenula sp. 1 TL-2023]